MRATIASIKEAEPMIRTVAELERVRDECRRLVTTRSLMSAAATVVPVPGVDLAADVGLMTTLLPAISQRFELDHAQVAKLDPRLAQQVLVIAASLGNHAIGRLVGKRLIVALLARVGGRVATASVARYVPLIGSAAAAAISFGAMRGIGNAHIDDCFETARRLIGVRDEASTSAISPQDERHELQRLSSP